YPRYRLVLVNSSNYALRGVSEVSGISIGAQEECHEGRCHLDLRRIDLRTHLCDQAALPDIGHHTDDLLPGRLWICGTLESYALADHIFAFEEAAHKGLTDDDHTWRLLIISSSE